MNIKELEDKALWVRRKVLEMAVAADSGHVSTAMSQTEILVALYYGGILRHDPKNPKWEDRDIFILSKGQGGIGLYPILADRGYFPLSDLDNFCGKGSKIGVHAESHCPGVEILSGSLGHGLPIATGIAQAFKADGKDNLVFCLVGDGELHEGSNWEALMSASQLKLGNLILIVDRNGQNTIGRTRGTKDVPMNSPKDGPALGPLGAKLEAFGFPTWEVDGHSSQLIVRTLDFARKYHEEDVPKALICNTVKGKGLSVMEDKRDWHYRAPRGVEIQQCQNDLGLGCDLLEDLPKPAQAKHGVAMRDRYFDALYEHFKADKNCVLITADNGWPGIDKFAALKNQFFQVGIAEQQMVGMAAGLALQGRKVWCYAIAPFVTTRVHEFLKLDACAMNLPIHMVGVGAGFAYDIMSTTHHTVEDITIMRVLPNMTVYSPSDGYVAAAVADFQAALPGPSYVRLDRGGLPDLHLQGDYYGSGVSVLEPGTDFLNISIISTGMMCATALKVSEVLGGAQVLDVHRLKPLNTQLLLTLLAEADRVVTLEEHQLNGGLGSIVAEAFVDYGASRLMPLLRIGVPDRFSFELGGREEIHKAIGLDVDSVVRRIKEWKV